MTLLEYLSSLPRGVKPTQLLQESAAAGGRPELVRDSSDPGHVIEFYAFADLDIKVFIETGAVSGIRYGKGFPGTIQGVRIGMHGKEVVAALGRAQRTWPMPHPNIILLYDKPAFLRIDVDRATERVIDIYR